MSTQYLALSILLVCLVGATPSAAQNSNTSEISQFLLAPESGNSAKSSEWVLDTKYSAKQALLRSLLFPGLGHKYVNDGAWNRWAVTYAAADVTLWLSLLGGEWHRNSLEDSYRTLAAGAAGAQLSGKDRSFYLNLASFESSDQFLDTMLRNRQWDQIGYVSEPSFQWEWETEKDYNRFRSLRNDAESLRRRKSILIASLVVNRLLSGAISARKASRSNSPQVSVSLSAPIENIPVLSLRVGF